MKNYILTCVIFLTVFNVSLYCQTNNGDSNSEKIVNKFSVGAGFGYTTGYGVSFRYTPNKFGVQVNFSPAYNENLTRISTGVTFIYKLIEAEKTCFYLYQGNHYNYYKRYSTINNGFNNGVGVGLQFIILKSIGLDIMGGYAFYDNFERLNLTGEAALYYKF